MNEQKMSNQLLTWYDEHRRVLPWRESPTPYHVLVSEIMLQQTRVETVKSYYQRFLEVLPTIADLAKCDEDVLMKCWQGLGYYSRARHLQETAKIVEEEFDGKIPSQLETLLSLPGIGSYTAGAILSIAFQKKQIAPDGNAYRIFARLTAEEGEVEQTKVRRKLEESMKKAIDEKRPGAWNQAIMDLGAMVCLSHGAPLCECCPIQTHCIAFQEGTMGEYPKHKAKKSRRKEEKTVFVFYCQDRILLEKRDSKGLLANLWALPMIDGKWDKTKVQEELYDLPLEREPVQLGETIHVFSHVEWHMIGYAIFLGLHTAENRAIFGSEEKERRWVTKESLIEAYAIPSAYRYFFDFPENESWKTK